MLCGSRRVPAGGGFTLLELLVVLIILGVVASLTQLGGDPVGPAQLDAASRDIVQVLRFAQAEAIRTGSYRVVDCIASSNTVRVYALNMGPKPPIEDPATPIMNPIDKHNYSLTLSARPGSAMAKVDSCQFIYYGAATSSRVTFGSDGAPVHVGGSNPSDVHQLRSGTVQFSAGLNRRTILVDGLTGRIRESS